MIFLSTFLVFIFLASISVCSSINYGPYTQLTSKFFLCDGDTIWSPGEVQFQLGFFTPKGNLNKSRYLGIWYLSDPEIIVWVANRDKPLPENSFASLGVDNGDGNLKLWDASGKVYFSTSTSMETPNTISMRTAKLKEGGNLVLGDKRFEDSVLWQSFDNPTDTFLPGMKMTQNLTLCSWRSSVDPSKGNYMFKQDKNGGFLTMNGTVKYWTSTGQSKIFTTGGKMAELTNFLLNDNPTHQLHNINKTVQQYPNFSKMRLVMSCSGEIQRWEQDVKNGWEKLWGEPESWCDLYKICGKFGICKQNVCDCLSGFSPEYKDSWKSGDYSSGCLRNSPWCGKEGNYTFLQLKVIDVDEELGQMDTVAKNETECRQVCVDNQCNCHAYHYRYDIRKGEVCFLWTSDLFNIKVAYDPNNHRNIDLGHGINIYVRVGNISEEAGNSEPGAIGETPPSPSQMHPRTKTLSLEILIISITFSVIAVILLLCCLSYIFYKRTIGRRRERRRQSIQENETSTVHLPNFSEEDKGKIDVPFFTLESILAATNSFSDAKKLGEGGFGPVYKGKFHGGQEIAVKRLSVNSMQGLEELKNEVVLIAKLQHRNLVKLLGYCIEGNESILLYEYMQNKSLDLFIFDQTLSVLLDWEKRFEIILGVARGLLYLHQDSRLRVIHRDLKVSNILLDEDMNPKISDFGLARIVGGSETEANTNRVVGTYGYMSPEYALEGIFSIKSDVFSFGVVVLEIISGKKNTGFYKAQHDLNLLGHAWRMWKEDNPLGLIDKAVAENCNKLEVWKCIIIGLLCVQEDPSDRPNMYNVVYMLGSSEIGSLPNPKQPAFVGRTNEKMGSSSDKSNIMSNNEVTLSRLEPR